MLEIKNVKKKWRMSDRMISRKNMTEERLSLPKYITIVTFKISKKQRENEWGKQNTYSRTEKTTKIITHA
jgi:hypothetical protein